MIISLTNAVVQGALLGCFYALCAAPLAIAFGIMRIVNIATGDMLVLAAFSVLFLSSTANIHPTLALVGVVVLMAALGYLLQRGILNYTLDPDMMRPLLVTLALSSILQNSLLIVASGDSRKVSIGGFETMGLEIVNGLTIGLFPLATAIAASLLIWATSHLIHRTELGIFFRAASDDPDIARAFGINERDVFSKAFAVVGVLTAIAGAFLAVKTQFNPFSGNDRLIYAFQVVVLGGLGSLRGVFLGGLILGVAQGLGAYFHPSLQIVMGHMVFVAVLIFRPTGFFGAKRN
ncbi:branched-chain amino acid ABC transporter permease [uncultured Tateyamaria sp.]|uniref:branched-chain amino acid ABC transporter permease n=1 Tax=uncultured Tateyamaria sp. TaxID=455651 RepID=UPI00260C8613|nr:branched-chain amino acid ABC transporter permease [uncultured Tateyamaria sp.]